mgnify:CR=1 FL=1|tara:strand:- start:2040 stop:2297 length:258 start_codon:yes stop_codon:yes gene_type:complete
MSAVKKIRRCCVTNEPVQSGYVWHNGDIYKHEKHLIPIIIDYLNEFATNEESLPWVEVSEKTLLSISYTFKLHYYTEWEDSYYDC